jgi:hypothetical protein
VRLWPKRGSVTSRTISASGAKLPYWRCSRNETSGNLPKSPLIAIGSLVPRYSAVAAWPLTARAQQAKVYTLDVLTLPNPEPLLTALREGLRRHGLRRGRRSLPGDTLG